MRAKKGSSFERKICKRLSRWWSNGKRDDIFWRSSQSGGRASFRAQKGLSTYGHHGDIAAVDPIGEPLLKLFTIELKRGDSHRTPADLLDIEGNCAKHPWMKCLDQTIRQHKAAGSFGWMMIFKRDRRAAMVVLESRIYRQFQANPLRPDKLRFNRRLRFTLYNNGVGFDFVVVPLERFLDTVTPSEVRQVLQHLQQSGVLSPQ